jgi:hypothetical protein
VFLDIGHPGCAVAATGPLGKPTECHSAPTHAGLVLFEHPRPAVQRGPVRTVRASRRARTCKSRPARPGTHRACAAVLARLHHPVDDWRPAVGLQEVSGG